MLPFEHQVHDLCNVSHGLVVTVRGAALQTKLVSNTRSQSRARH